LYKGTAIFPVRDELKWQQDYIKNAGTHVCPEKDSKKQFQLASAGGIK
jgi:hypothetical protein